MGAYDKKLEKGIRKLADRVDKATRNLTRGERLRLRAEASGSFLLMRFILEKFNLSNDTLWPLFRIMELNSLISWSIGHQGPIELSDEMIAHLEETWEMFEGPDN